MSQYYMQQQYCTTPVMPHYTATIPYAFIGNIHVNEYYVSYKVLIFCVLFLSMIIHNMMVTIAIKNITPAQVIPIIAEEEKDLSDLSLLTDVPVQ